MLEKLSDHLEQLSKTEPAIARQFVADDIEDDALECNSDPLLEDAHQPVCGLINKYGNRVVCFLTAECAAYCRFCTRRRMVSDINRWQITKADVDLWAEYLYEHTEITEVILSGGDPFVAPIELFSYALEKISSIRTITVLRIGTRVPVSDPDRVKVAHLEVIRSVEQPVYIGINFEHPSEITPETEKVLTALRKSGAILYSQTVFLQGVNDDYDILFRLFSRLIEIGVRPYYIYRCDPVEGIEHFRGSFEKELSIMSRLRRSLSGIACPTYVVDTPNGNGKVPVALDFWDVDYSSYRDFDGKLHQNDDKR